MSVKKKVIIAGGSGFLGTHLSKELIERRHEVLILTRGNSKEEDGIQYVHWDINKPDLGLDASVFSEEPCLVNLCGKHISDKRWTSSFKETIYKSRVKPAEALVNYVNISQASIDTFVSASAIGFYGFSRPNEVLTEDSDPGADFFGDLVYNWEKPMHNIDSGRAKKVIIPRIGVIFDKEEGAYIKLKQPILLGLGTALGSGKQYMSWIHIRDVLNFFIEAIEGESLSGTYNLVSPDVQQNRRVISQIANSLNKPILLPPVPSFVLKLVLGEMANTVLGSLNIDSSRLEADGFRFKYEKLEDAVRNLNWQ